MPDSADADPSFPDWRGPDRAEVPLDARAGNGSTNPAAAGGPTLSRRPSTDADRAGESAAQHAGSPTKSESESGLISGPKADRETDGCPNPHPPFICARSTSGPEHSPRVAGQLTNPSGDTISVPDPGPSPRPLGLSSPTHRATSPAMRAADDRHAPPPKQADSRSSARSIQVNPPEKSPGMTGNVAAALLCLIQRVMDRRAAEAPATPNKAPTPPDETEGRVT